jgi:hypothetical protein
VHTLEQVGTDANAEMLRNSLQDAGVDLQHLRQVDGSSGSAIILLQPSGEPLPLWHISSRPADIKVGDFGLFAPTKNKAREEFCTAGIIIVGFAQGVKGGHQMLCGE